MRNILALGTSLAIAAIVPAQAQQPRSVEYFIMHNAERQQVNRICTGGIAAAIVNAECVNAHQAGVWIARAETQQRISQNRAGIGSIYSPLYWDANPYARAGILHDCDYPTPGIMPDHATCQAARISAGR